MKKKKLLAYLLVLTFLFSSINISVYGATTAGVDYEIAVAMDPAQISVDLSAFEADLKAEMISQYAAQHAPAAITDDDIQISFLKPNTVTMQVQSAWNIRPLLQPNLFGKQQDRSGQSGPAHAGGKNRTAILLLC